MKKAYWANFSQLVIRNISVTEDKNFISDFSVLAMMHTSKFNCLWVEMDETNNGQGYSLGEMVKLQAKNFNGLCNSDVIKMPIIKEE